ncbi:GntR family transcriptional regulator [Micromonospora sp. NPDC051296]|uniref:GntR family transcriptional regulator n=1 Tax=Micromonospora sp. NPDC051296 TaxID=3155046 RepID=UPI003446D3CD
MPTPHYGQPRYRVIADEIRKRLEHGIIAPGALLPTESALTAEFRASRGTIRQAIATLRDEGLVSTEHGRGTHATIQTNGQSDATEREVLADNRLASLFAVRAGTTLIEVERVTRKNGQVESVIRTYRTKPPSPAAP